MARSFDVKAAPDTVVKLFTESPAQVHVVRNA